MYVLFLAVAVYTVVWIPICLYLKWGIGKWFYHDLLQWHEPDNTSISNDGVNRHSVCRHCGIAIMQDSQGNWFEA